MNKKLIKALSALTGAGMMGTAGTLHTFAADAAGDMNAAGGIGAMFTTLGIPLLLLVFL